MNIEEKIKAYLSSQLSTEEMAAFKKEMDSDEDLAAKVKGWELVLLAREDIFQEQLREKMKEITLPSFPPPVPWWKRYRFVLGIGLLLLGIGGYSWSKSENLNHDEVNSTKIENHIEEEEFKNIFLDSLLENESRAFESLKKGEEEKNDSLEPIKEKVPVKVNPPKKKESSQIYAQDNKNNAPSFEDIRIENLLALTDDYMSPDLNNILPNLRSAGTSANQDSLLQKVWEQSDSSRFEYALKNTELGESEKRNLRGHFYYKIRVYDKAAVNFKLLTESEIFGQDAEWYLLLSYIAQFPKTKAEIKETACNSVDSEDHFHHKKWKKLKQEILDSIKNDDLPKSLFDCDN